MPEKFTEAMQCSAMQWRSNVGAGTCARIPKASPTPHHPVPHTRFVFVTTAMDPRALHALHTLVLRQQCPVFANFCNNSVTCRDHILKLHELSYLFSRSVVSTFDKQIQRLECNLRPVDNKNWTHWWRQCQQVRPGASVRAFVTPSRTSCVVPQTSQNSLRFDACLSNTCRSELTIVFHILKSHTWCRGDSPCPGPCDSGFLKY